MDIGDKVIKDIGEAYLVLRDRVPELEAENEKLKKCCSQRGARMQIMDQHLTGSCGFVIWNNYHRDDFFDKDGVPK